MRFDRRRFIKVGSSALAGLVVGSGMAAVGSRARQSEAGPAEERVPVRCGQCSSGCALLAHIRDGRVTKLEIDSESGPPAAEPCPRGLLVS